MTLAQRLINGEGVVIEDINLHIYVLDRLAPRPNATVADARLIADKFMFEADPTKAMMAQVESKVITPDLIWNTARPIAQPMWMEWSPAKDILYGFLVDAEPGKTIITFCCGGTARCGVAMKITFPGPAPFTFESMRGKSLMVQSTDAFIGGDTAKIQRMSFSLMRDAIDGMFVLCTPRVANTEPLIPARPVRRRQLREHPTKPMVEFRTVKMRIGVAQPRYAQTYDPTGDHEVIHRRLHRVIGHYRVYTKNHDQPLVAFVPEHWRGDPELGIVLHNREVKA